MRLMILTEGGPMTEGRRHLRPEDIVVQPVVSSEDAQFYLADSDPTDWAHIVIGDDLRDDWY